MPEGSANSLNSNHERRLSVTCRYIDKLLADMESVLSISSSRLAFPQYTPDLTSAQRRVVEDYIGRIRAQLIRVLDGQNIERPSADIPVARSLHSTLTFVDIAVEELKPEYMRGYGEVPPQAAVELNGIAGELQGLVRQLDHYLMRGTGENLQERLERWEHTGDEVPLLRKLETVITEHGLVEFRSTLSMILDRLEDRNFEIALFGRVSSGKSSLLNAILETDVLPVGVTPITAVPTRITHAEEASLTIWFSEAPRQKCDVSRLGEFATEQQNPGNSKHVSRLVLALRSMRLRGGVSFVDTPGLGSLATSGASETLAYLPKCDLGVVLIDAGSTLTAEDLQTILALQEAAIPVKVLLSKADLIGAEDRVRSVQYVKDHIASECKLALPVHPVSVLASCREMLNEWFENEIVPLYARSQELRMASLRRKIGTLRDSVARSLEARLRRGGQSSLKSRARAEDAENLLRKATGRIEETRSACARFVMTARTQAERGSTPDISEEAGKRLRHSWETSSYGVLFPGQLIRVSINQFIQTQARKLQSDIQDLAGHLVGDLRECAWRLGLSDVPTEGEFESLVRGTPIFECPGFPIVISRPRFALLLGQRGTVRLVAGQIARQLKSPFYAALETYWRLIGEWSEFVMGHLRQKFETYAENYRAQAEQTLGGREFTQEELAGLEDSLGQLKPDLAGTGPRLVNPERAIRTPLEETA